MQFDTGERKSKSDATQRVRIGSRVPDENLDWLKRHGIVTDQNPPERVRPKKNFATASFALFFSWALVLLCLALLVQQHQYANEALKQAGLRLESLEFSNRHLLARLERLSELGKVQQFEINRLNFEIENVRWGLGRQIGSLEKQVELERSIGAARDAVGF